MFRDERGRLCPVCPTSQLKSEPSMARCPHCSGTWLSTGELMTIVDELPPFVVSASTSQVRRCPTCREPMEQGESGGVVVDRCLEHGYWFDYQEYRAFMKSVG